MADRSKLESTPVAKEVTVASSTNMNTFANDGSFMEMFKKKMEEEKRRKEEQEKVETPKTENTVNQPKSTSQSGTGDDPSSSTVEADEPKSKESQNIKKKTGLSFFVGKRKGLTLKTGQVKKPKQTTEEAVGSDPWSHYLAEVQKYKSRDCSDEDKTRPLVK